MKSLSFMTAIFSSLVLSAAMGKAVLAQPSDSFLLSENLPTPVTLPRQTALPPIIQPTALSAPLRVSQGDRTPVEVASVTPISGKIDLRVRNNMGAQVVFEAAGYLLPNRLIGGQSMTIHNLPTPIAVKISRADGGLLKVRPIRTSDVGVLEVAIEEGNRLSDDSGIVRIQPNGRVSLTH